MQERETKTQSTVQSPVQEEPPQEVIDQKDLAVLWAIGILVSLLLSFAGASWRPAQYEARQSTSVDATEARVENSQNQMVADALNDGTIEYDPTMDKLVTLKPVYVLIFFDVVRLSLFPTSALVIIGLLIRKSVRLYKPRKTV
ncbi:MAG: hypothetical protein ACE5F7_08600 [Nitrospiria bacterium]